MVKKKLFGVLVILIFLISVMSVLGDDKKYWSNSKGDIIRHKTQPLPSYFEISQGLYNRINEIKEKNPAEVKVEEGKGFTATFEMGGKSATFSYDKKGEQTGVSMSVPEPPEQQPPTGGGYNIGGNAYSEEQLKAMGVNNPTDPLQLLSFDPRKAEKLSALDGENFIYDGKVYADGEDTGKKVPSWMDATELDFTDMLISFEADRTLLNNGEYVDAGGNYYKSDNLNKPIRTVTLIGDNFKVEEGDKIFLRDRKGRTLAEFSAKEYKSIINTGNNINENNILAIKRRAEEFGIKLSDLKDGAEKKGDFDLTVTAQGLKVVNTKEETTTQYDNQNRITQQTGAGVTTTYSYDAKGRAKMSVNSGNVGIEVDLNRENLDDEGRYRVTSFRGANIEGYDTSDLRWEDGKLYGKNIETGEFEEIPADKLDEDTKKALEQGQKNKDKWAQDTYGERSFLDSWRFGQEQFYSGISGLIREFEWYQDYIKFVDQWIAKLFDTDFWSSNLCRTVFKLEPEDSLMIATPSGTYQFVAHLEAEKSKGLSPITCSDELPCRESEECEDGICYKNDEVVTGRFYKITWAVKAPADEKFTPFIDENGYAIKYNIGLGLKRDCSERDVKIWLTPADGIGNKNTLKLKNGETDSNAYVAYSSEEYGCACIVWGAPPKDRDLISVGNMCINFVDSNRGEVNWKDSEEEEGAVEESVTVSDVGTKRI